MMSEESYIWSKYTPLEENDQKECQMLQSRLLAKLNFTKVLANSFSEFATSGPVPSSARWSVPLGQVSLLWYD